MNLEWSPYLSVGVSVIDNQHIELFGRFNGLLDALTQGGGSEEMASVVKFLEGYVVTHFTMEEQIMERYSYAATSAHKAQHAKFIDDFSAFKRQLATIGASKLLALNMLKQLGEWLVNHVGNTDRQLGGFLKVAMAVKKAA